MSSVAPSGNRPHRRGHEALFRERSGVDERGGKSDAERSGVDTASTQSTRALNTELCRIEQWSTDVFYQLRLNVHERIGHLRGRADKHVCLVRHFV